MPARAGHAGLRPAAVAAAGLPHHVGRQRRRRVAPVRRHQGAQGTAPHTPHYSAR